MSSSVPAQPSVTDIREAFARSRTEKFVKNVQTLWYLTKVSRMGQYSARSVQELEKYCQTSSLTRVLCVCVLTPCPAFLLAVSMECIPLQDPNSGWTNNFGMWIRLWGFLMSAALGSLSQIRSENPELSNLKMILIGLGTSCCSDAILMAFSSLWMFPLPFSIAIASIPFQVFFMTFFLVSIRAPNTSLAARLTDPIQRKLHLILAPSVLSFVYFAFSAVFVNCKPKQQFGMLLLLPVIKILSKHSLARILSDNQEAIPAVVVFTVDVFNGLYTSICIQSSRSWWASMVMVVMNGIYTISSFREVDKEAGALELLNFQNMDVQNMFPVQQDKLQTPRARGSMSLFASIRQKSQVFPMPTLQSTESTTKFDQRSTKMLFRLEYLSLVKYIETVIPTLFVVYLYVLYHLPSAKYYPHTRSLSRDQLHTNIGSIMIYASVELFFLVWLHVMLKRKSGFSLLYQLAFVLETETRMLQGRLFTWIPPMLQLTLLHFGMDFTFRFQWKDSTRAP